MLSDAGGPNDNRCDSERIGIVVLSVIGFLYGLDSGSIGVVDS